MTKATLRGITVDCADPESLAHFYRELTGFEVAFDSDEYVILAGDAGWGLGFQKVSGYSAPTWPSQDVPQQLHLDFHVDDLDAAETRVLSLGAIKADHQSDIERYRVYLDPAGHPFCLTIG